MRRKGITSSLGTKWGYIMAREELGLNVSRKLTLLDFVSSWITSVVVAKCGIEGGGWSTRPVKIPYGFSLWGGIMNNIDVFSKFSMIKKVRVTKYYFRKIDGLETSLCRRDSTAYTASGVSGGCWNIQFHRV